MLTASLLVSVASQAGGQQQATVLSRHDVALLAEATAGAAALTLLDARVARALSDSGLQARHPGIRSAANGASIVTETVLMIAGGSVYVLARIRKEDGVADVALHTTEAVAAGALFIQVVRGALGRARPDVTDEPGDQRDADPYDVGFMRGFTSYDYRSFPSMHAMASFAAATALTQEMRFRDTPHRRAIGPALYLGAAMPSLARLYLDEHWTSDVVMGAFLGVFAGQKAVQYSHAHPDNRVDHALLGPRLNATLSRGAHGWSLSLLPF
jgi:hypothetical protein